MKNKTFRKDRLAVTISLAMGAGMMSPAMLQAQEDGAALEEITVTGIRASLDRAMDTKRDAQGVVDAISAEDIGKMPDTNLAESMQRITGVAIDRVNGEGSRVTVRGLGPDFNLVTLNGRQLARTTGGRSFDFANIASEMVQGVVVSKTSDSTVASGGMGATIDLLTARPLEIGEQRAMFSGKGVYDESSQDPSFEPELSGFYSDTFADGTFGVAISASVQERKSGEQMAQVGTGWRSFEGIVDQDWSGPNAQWGGVPQENQVNRPGEGDIYSVPQTTIYKFDETQRKRTNGQLVMQWAPSDNITATADYSYYSNEISMRYNDISAWYNFGPSENVWTDGPIASPLIYSETFGAPTDLSMGAGGTDNKHQGDSFGVNLEWQVNDRLSLDFDAHTSDAERTPNGKYGSNYLLSTAAFIRTKSASDFTEELPALYVENGNSVLPSDMRVTGSVFGNSRDFSEIDAFRFAGNFELTENSDIDFGIGMQEVSNRSQAATVQRNAWGGVGAEGDFDDSYFPAESIQDKFDIATGDFSEDPTVNASDIQDIYFAWDFDRVVARANELYGSDLEPGLVGDCGTQFCPSSDFGAERDQSTSEETAYFFTKYNLSSEVQGMPYDFSLGLRYEDTQVDSTAAVSAYTSAAWIADTEILLGDPERQYLSQSGSYDYWLPSATFKLDVTEDVVVRAAASQSIARPDYDSLKGGTVMGALANTNEASGSSGNPGLLPYESVNFDLGVEWYYAESSYASVTYFRKEVSNFITGGTSELTLDIPNPSDSTWTQEARAAGATNAREIKLYIAENYGDSDRVDVAYVNGDPAQGIDPTATVIRGDFATDNPYSFLLSVPVNGDRDETINGWELNVQHMFADTGFGVQANYTIVDSELEYNPFLLQDQEALIGLSDTANLSAFYDKNGIQARIAYNWRDQFLNSRGQGTGANPQFTEAYQQVDMNVSYEMPQVEGLQVFLEGLNITDEYGRVHGRSERQVLGVYQGGSRWQLGARYEF